MRKCGLNVLGINICFVFGWHIVLDFSELWGERNVAEKISATLKTKTSEYRFDMTTAFFAG